MCARLAPLMQESKCLPCCAPACRAAFGQVTAAQQYRADKPLMTKYFNVNIRLSAPLALPVRGLLAPSYNAALARATARPQAAALGAARNVTFSAEVRGN